MRTEAVEKKRGERRARPLPADSCNSTCIIPPYCLALSIPPLQFFINRPILLHFKGIYFISINSSWAEITRGAEHTERIQKQSGTILHRKPKSLYFSPVHRFIA